MKVFLGIAFCVQFALAVLIGATVNDQARQIASWSGTAKTLSQENSNLSTRTYDLLLLTTPTSPSDAATKFAVAVCSQDGAAAYATLSPDLAASVDAQAKAYGVTTADLIQNLVALPDGTVCTNVVYRGAYLDQSGNAVIIEVFVYTDSTRTWSETYLITVVDGVVDGVH